MTRGADYVAIVRQHNRAIWEGINALQVLQREWNALNYGETLATEGGVAPEDVGAVVFASADALVAVLDNGQAGNMAKLL